MEKFNINKVSKLSECKDCKGLGWILITDNKTYTECIICNSSGTTSQGPNGIDKEAQQTLLFKKAWDYINGKEKGWYH
jgi:DnaJ-class molecular chaperone